MRGILVERWVPRQGAEAVKRPAAIFFDQLDFTNWCIENGCPSARRLFDHLLEDQWKSYMELGREKFRFSAMEIANEMVSQEPRRSDSGFRGRPMDGNSLDTERHSPGSLYPR